MPFQNGIELILNKESGIDIAEFILLLCLGSPLGPFIKKDDGSLYRSGTEQEFDLIIQTRAVSSAETDETLESLRDQRRLEGHPLWNYNA